MLVLVATPARAHDFRPGVLVVDLAADGTLALRVQLPPEHRDTPPTFILPDGCRLTRPLPALRAACDPASPGALTITDLAPDLELVAHVRVANSPPRSTILRADAPTVSLTETHHDPFPRYLALGLEHILGGLDHLFFVIGLTLWTRTATRVLTTLTAFTAAHSLTLALATFKVVHLPGPPVEACIALSIVLLARAVLEPNLSPGTPWRFALACGLLHGFGFAGALADVGLPDDAVLPALAAFNIGVELGQLALALALAVLAALAARLAPRLPLRRLVAYALGGVAAAWTLERVLALGTTA
jgi:hydrogenase/urease accessory protein HupE